MTLPLPAVALLFAVAAVAAIHLYATVALVAQRRLASRGPPPNLAAAVAVGLVVPACGCTALPYARRAMPNHRAAFLVAAYAGSPLLVAAAWLLAGLAAAAGVALLAVCAALAAAFVAPSGDAPPRMRLDDLLLRRESRPFLDAAPYTRTWAVPALAAGALLGAASLAPAVVAGAALAALALLLSAPTRDIATDHGRGFAKRVRGTQVTFALAAGLVTGVLA